jgi:hypothetical protein
MAPRRRILVIANKTADSPQLIAALRGRQACEASVFTLLVPAVPRGLSWAANMTAGWQEAIPRAEAASERMRLAGIALEGAVVGDPDPFAAAGDLLHSRPFDAVVVSTLPHSISRWLRVSLPQRIARAFAIPVEHVVSPPPVSRYRRYGHLRRHSRGSGWEVARIP